MRIGTDVRNVPIARPGGRTIEGVMEVRRVDARFGRRGLLFERRTPLAVVVRQHDAVRRISMPQGDALPPAAAMVAGPALYFLVRRLVKKGRKR